MSATCLICGKVASDGERCVLASGDERRTYCSPACLRVAVRTARLQRRRLLVRGAAALVAVALVLVAVGWMRQRLRHPRGTPAPIATPSPIVAAPPPEETPFGPHWPPTDDEWLAEFAHSAWVYPLPGPARRRPAGSPERFVADAPGAPRARCRTTGRCGVDLGGELWGEHVYAAHDGVIDRVQRTSEDAPGGLYVRVAHWGGAVFTHYFHLAAVPTRLAAGMHVEAGDVLGLAGDTGLANARTHLHFALSVRPSSALPEVYWDPEPLMASWPLRTPGRGSVAGLVAPEAPPEPIAGAPSLHRRAPPARAKLHRHN